MIYIAGNTTEWHKEIIEIAVTLVGIWGIELQILDIHRYRIHKTCGNYLIGDGLFGAEIHIDSHPFGRRVGSGKIISVVLTDCACAPVGKSGRGKEVHHLLRSPAAGIKTSHDGPHRGACHIINRNIIVFQRLYHAHMGDSLGASATQHKSDTLSQCVAALRSLHRRHYAKHSHQRDKQISLQSFHHRVQNKYG